MSTTPAVQGSDASGAAVDPRHVVNQLKQLRMEHTKIESKIGELELQLNEHRVVAAAMRKVEPTRTAYRLVGGVLIQRTAGEVLPAVEENAQNITKAIQTLQKQLALKTNEISDLIVKHKIRFLNEAEMAQLQQQMQQQQQSASQKPSSESPTGLLV
ncbi:prefoldin subunit 2 [Pelomyxa schiedti]|nr:prefoldin subunit 2 [Pelomyxa schiedti]